MLTFSMSLAGTVCRPVAGLVLLGAWALAATTNEIKVDQAGYLADSPKLAMLAREKGEPIDGGSFTVHSARDFSVVFRGTLSAAAFAADSGEKVQIADFSGLSQSGRYYLEIPDVGRSWDFSIGPD